MTGSRNSVLLVFPAVMIQLTVEDGVLPSSLLGWVAVSGISFSYFLGLIISVMSKGCEVYNVHI